jgi:glycerol-3-phosphate acyltransferase PlsX
LLQTAAANLKVRLSIHPAAESIGMDESPVQVLRSKPDSSMRRMLELVRDGRAHAGVSAGNSGALMVLSRQVLGTLAGIDRPAMASSVPTLDGSCLLLDLGANVDCSAQQLLQFAIMGSVLAEILGVARPRVALLNIGSEAIKGNQQVREAARLLQGHPLLPGYCGFVEGDGVYRGAADVVVCDGFAGNVLLKASEGVARLMLRRLEALLRRSWWGRLVGLLARPLLRRLRDELHPAGHNGAALLGLPAVVVKSHGGAGERDFAAAIRRALLEARLQVPQCMAQRLASLPAVG